MTHDPLATAVINAVRQLREEMSVECPETGATVMDPARIDRIVDDLEHTVVSYRDEMATLRRARDEAREQCARAQERMRKAEESLRTVAAAARELRRIEIARAEAGVLAHGADLDALWRAQDALDAFVTTGPCYAGVSWGKDSTVLAHMVATRAPEVPLVWVRVEPIMNPDSVLVRDAFLGRFAARYEEIAIECPRRDGLLDPSGTMERGFAAARQRCGPRRLSGVRAAESGTRAMTMRRSGQASADSARPIGWWSAADVWAYLWVHGLPVHPAYGCSQGGMWDRDRLRVGGLGRRPGRGHGRLEWETRYYGAELAALRYVQR